MTGQNPPVQPAPEPAQVPQAPQGTSGFAIAGLVIGVLALVTAFIPIVNNGSFVIAIIGLILSIVGRTQTSKGAKQGSGIAIAGIVLCIIALAVTLMVQAACSAALDSVTSNGSGTVASTSAASGDSTENASAERQTDTANMAVGQTVDMDSGLSVTVNSVTPGLANFNGSTVASVSVTYTNNGSSGESFNVYDWKAEDANGAQRSMTYYSESADELSSGTLSPGGSVTGNIYFDEPVVKVYYYSNLLSSNSDIAWVVG